jgi:hypothetical protein
MFECKCGYIKSNGGPSPTELKMAEMDPSRTAMEYHVIMELFEDAFDVVFEEDNG